MLRILCPRTFMIVGVLRTNICVHSAWICVLRVFSPRLCGVFLVAAKPALCFGGECQFGTGVGVFDVCVIGSGPAGGVLSKELAEAGAKVALVEAGRTMSPNDFHPHAWPYELPYRGLKEGLQPDAAYPRELTKAIQYQDCDDIFVDRIRAVGGRSIHWNGTCLRFAERDFRERSLEGIEEDWPLTYQELAPYYSYVERMIGVSGTREHLEIIPDGEFLRP